MPSFNILRTVAQRKRGGAFRGAAEKQHKISENKQPLSAPEGRRRLLIFPCRTENGGDRSATTAKVKIVCVSHANVVERTERGMVKYR